MICISRIRYRKQSHEAFDANKHYSSALKFRYRPYVAACKWDTWEVFDKTKHKIQYGEYLLKAGIYRCTRTNIYFNHNLYSYNMIIELLHRKVITLDDIRHFRKVKKILPADYFTQLVDKMFEILPAKYAKQIVNSLIGGLNMLTNKKAHYYVADNED